MTIVPIYKNAPFSTPLIFTLKCIIYNKKKNISSFIRIYIKTFLMQDFYIKFKSTLIFLQDPSP